MWKYYMASDYFVNLNSGEIFGMSILEAMFYRLTVIALSAPGPSYIINNGINGYLVDSDAEIVDMLSGDNVKRTGNEAHDRIMKSFTWDSTARLMVDKMKEIGAIQR